MTAVCVAPEGVAVGGLKDTDADGAEDYFEPARRLYERYGFTPCAPFADYTDDPNSVYLSRAL